MDGGTATALRVPDTPDRLSLTDRHSSQAGTVFPLAAELK